MVPTGKWTHFALSYSLIEKSVIYQKNKYKKHLWNSFNIVFCCNSWLISLHTTEHPAEKASVEKYTISNSEASQVGHMKGVATSMHKWGRLNLQHHVFEAFLTDIKFSIYPCQWHQVVEPFAFWHLVYEGGTFWICLDYRSFWVIQKYNSHFSVNTVAALKAFLLHLPIFTSFAHESQQKHKTNAVCFSTFHTIFGCVLIWALM